MSKIDIHADDFGESVQASRDILQCIRAGKLDSISVLSNMSCFKECVALYREVQPTFPKAPAISVHMNFMEGSCLSDPSEVSDLVDQTGHFSISWGKLFLGSYLPGRKKLKKQLKTEMKAQIEAVRDAFPEMEKLRIDSHQHTHMIPVVSDALFETLRENNWQVAYIRNAKEPIGPFLKEFSLYKTYRPVNFVKNMILNYCSCFLEGRLKKEHLEPMYLWGLVMSGHMDEVRVTKLLPAMKRRAEKKGRTLEILFHPGQVQREEITEEFSQQEAIAFHVSEDRHVEKAAVMNLTIEKRNDDFDEGEIL